MDVPLPENKEIRAASERDWKQLSIGHCSSFKSCWNNIIKGNKGGIYDLPAGNSSLHLLCGVNTVCKAGGGSVPAHLVRTCGQACAHGSAIQFLPLFISSSGLWTPILMGFGISCLKGLVLFSLTCKPKTICCNRWQQAGILRARYFTTGAGPSS